MASNLGSFDVTVIGAGSMGSACARHLTRLCDQKICLIGPDEPDIPRMQSGSSVFGAHYDAGRITRILDPDIVWAKLAKRSIRRYRQIEKESGIQFYTPCGFLAVGFKDGDYIRKIADCARSLDVNVAILEHRQLKDKFPYLSFPSNSIGIYEQGSAGYVNIRKKVKAEIVIAEKQGCCIIKEIVNCVSRVNKDRFKIITESGSFLDSQKVVIATGAFTPYKDLLADVNKKLDISCCTQTVVKLEIADDNLQQMLSMPSIICNFGDDLRYNCYILPPIQYSDGKHYIKIGHGERHSKPLHGHQQVVDWYRGNGSNEAAVELRQLIGQIMPKFLQNNSIRSDCCVTAHTPHNHLMVGEIRRNLVILVGGNGYAAKSADEIGRVGALAALNSEWNYDIPQNEFRICYQSRL